MRLAQSSGGSVLIRVAAWKRYMWYSDSCTCLSYEGFDPDKETITQTKATNEI